MTDKSCLTESDQSPLTSPVHAYPIEPDQTPDTQYARPTARPFSGAFGMLITPFRDDGSPDLAALADQADAQCSTRLAGLVVCGSTGEFALLAPNENEALIRTAAAAVKGRKMLIAGATAPDARTAMQYLDVCADVGVTAALIAPPYYYPISDDELVCFYETLSSHPAKVPIIAYQIPAFTRTITMPVFEQLLAFDRIIGLKNSSGNIKEIMHQLWSRDQKRISFHLFCGTDDALLPCLAAGCDGSLTALGGILPEQIARLYEAFVAGDLPAVAAAQSRLMPLLRLCDRFSFPIGYKLLGEAVCITIGSLRQSLPPARRDECVTVQNKMKALLAGG